MGSPSEHTSIRVKIESRKGGLLRCVKNRVKNTEDIKAKSGKITFRKPKVGAQMKNTILGLYSLQKWFNKGVLKCMRLESVIMDSNNYEIFIYI